MSNKNKGGRPTVMTKEVIAKLEEAFRFTYTDSEACLYAGISEDTLYKYQRRYPHFVKQKTLLRNTPNLHAKETLVKNIPGNLDQSRWWAKNAPSMRQEYGEVTKLEHSGTIDTNDVGLHPEDEEIRLKLKAQLKENIRKRALAKANQKPNENTK